ncbi:MAG: hypothetical protein WB767_17605 [Nocardioides sp.]
MTVIVVVMLSVLVLCGVISLYVAYPHRGEQIPGASWLGDAMERAASAVPLMSDEDVARGARESTTAR